MSRQCLAQACNAWDNMYVYFVNNILHITCEINVNFPIHLHKFPKTSKTASCT